MRSRLAAAPNATAAPTAAARQGGGASRAGATVQNPVLPSPDTKEQLRRQAPSKR